MRNTSQEPIAVALLGSRGIPARYGGFETLTETLAQGLPKNRFRITVFCESSLRKLQPNIPGVNFIYFPVFESFRIASEVFYDIVALVWAAFAHVRVVILFGYTASIFCILPRFFGKRVLVNVDGLEWKREKFPRPVRRILKLSELMVTKAPTGIICDSHAIQARFRRRYHVESEYAPNPVSEFHSSKTNILERLNLQTGSYFLVVARLEPENHIDMIVKAFLECDTEKKIVIVGPLTNTKFVKRLLAMQTDRILFTGGIYDREALNALRRKAFAYVHGHEVGGTNPSLLESMACSSPVIAFDVPFNREVARDAALYFSDQKDLAECMNVLERNSRKRERMASEAKRIAQSDYSTSRAIGRYARIIFNAQARKSPG